MKYRKVMNRDTNGVKFGAAAGWARVDFYRKYPVIHCPRCGRHDPTIWSTVRRQSFHGKPLAGVLRLAVAGSTLDAAAMSTCFEI